jgi:hypothetical protein
LVLDVLLQLLHRLLLLVLRVVVRVGGVRLLLLLLVPRLLLRLGGLVDRFAQRLLILRDLAAEFGDLAGEVVHALLHRRADVAFGC